MSNVYRWIAISTGLLVVAFLVWYFHVIVGYILIAAVLSLIGKPLVNLIGKLKIKGWSPPKWLAALVTLSAMIAVILLSAQALIPVILEKADQLASIDPHQITGALSQPIGQIEAYVNKFLPDKSFSIQHYLTELLSPLISEGAIGGWIADVTATVAAIAWGAFCVAFITYFFLKEDNLFMDGVVLLFPSQYEANIKRAVNSSTRLLIRYFIGLCLEMIIKLICITLPLWFIGFDFSTALVIGAISALLNVIPYVGPLIGALAGIAIALLAPVEGVATGFVIFEMVVIFGLFQLIDNVILQPYIYSSSVKAHPLEIFIVILMAGYIAGVWGMLLAIPAYTVLRVFAKEFFNNFRVVQKLTENI